MLTAVFGEIPSSRDKSSSANRNQIASYRYGYQGQFAEKDDETGWNHFELREYDPVIGRWTAVDPKRQFYSPYVSMGNNPVSGIDPTGGESPIFDSETGAFLGLDKNGWNGPILFMTYDQYKGLGGAAGLRTIDASTLGLNDHTNHSFGSNLEAWSHVMTFLLTNKNIPAGLGLEYGNQMLSVGMGYVDRNGQNQTINSYLGGEFSANTAMYVDNTNRITIVVNEQGKLEAPVYFGNVWEVVNTGAHENEHRGLHWGPAIADPKRRAELELKAIRVQKAHSSWKFVSGGYQAEINRYQQFNKNIYNTR